MGNVGLREMRKAAKMAKRKKTINLVLFEEYVWEEALKRGAFSEDIMLDI